MDYINKTKKWVEEFVIGLNLCPFAGKPFSQDLIRYEIIDGDDIKAITDILMKELLLLQKTPATEIETTLLIFKDTFGNFEDYLNYTYFAEEVLVKLDLEGVLQIATFHPNYVFEDSELNDPANATNRSPFPMLHILREDSVQKAIDEYPNVDLIPIHNIEKLRSRN